VTIFENAAEPALSNVLNYVDVVAVSNAECKAVYGNQIGDNMVCVAGEYNEGTCAVSTAKSEIIKKIFCG
jgi:hypothetical protein